MDPEELSIGPIPKALTFGYDMLTENVAMLTISHGLQNLRHACAVAS